MAKEVFQENYRTMSLRLRQLNADVLVVPIPVSKVDVNLIEYVDAVSLADLREVVASTLPSRPPEALIQLFRPPIKDGEDHGHHADGGEDSLEKQNLYDLRGAEEASDGRFRMIRRRIIGSQPRTFLPVDHFPLFDANTEAAAHFVVIEEGPSNFPTFLSVQPLLEQVRSEIETLSSEPDQDVDEAGRSFEQKWRGYFFHNRSRTLGDPEYVCSCLEGMRVANRNFEYRRRWQDWLLEIINDEFCRHVDEIVGADQLLPEISELNFGAHASAWVDISSGEIVNKPAGEVNLADSDSAAAPNTTGAFLSSERFVVENSWVQRFMTAPLRSRGVGIVHYVRSFPWRMAQRIVERMLPDPVPEEEDGGEIMVRPRAGRVFELHEVSPSLLRFLLHWMATCLRVWEAEMRDVSYDEEHDASVVSDTYVMEFFQRGTRGEGGERIYRSVVFAKYLEAWSREVNCSPWRRGVLRAFPNYFF